MADEAIAIIGRTRMLVIDCSESMSSCDRTTMTRNAAQILIDELRTDDRRGLLFYRFSISVGGRGSSGNKNNR